MIPENRYVTIDETASILAVSSATVRNWIKHEYLRPSGRVSGIMFRYDEVRRLHKKIMDGSIPRLSRRANKATAKRLFIPDEYLGDRGSRGMIERIVACIAGADLDIDRAFFVMVLTRLFAEGVCRGHDLGRFIKEGFPIPGMVRLCRELRAWHGELGNFRITKEYNPLFGLDLPRQRDVLGLIYQSLRREGDKAASGSYYTPDHIVDEIVRSAPAGLSRVLDPCCGTGQFLLAFAGKTGDPRSLYGSDIDALAVRLARINMMLMFRDIDFDPPIYRGNFLLDGTFGAPGRDGFDMIATNPPWGLHFTRDEVHRLKTLYPDIRSGESFSCILKKSIDLLKHGGSLSFILPESMLNVRLHGDIRKYILEHASIERITRLGRAFKNVFTPVIRLDLTKSREGGRFAFIAGGRKIVLDQDRFTSNADCLFDVTMDRADSRIMDKVYGHGHVTLRGAADWALGIVTGDNAKYIRDDMGEGYEPVYKGRDVNPYSLGEPSGFIRFQPDRFQQSAPESRYRAPEKLVYRFISKNLIVAYDDRRCLTLNSANLLIPRPGGYPMKAVLALFNSSLYQYIFQKKFSSIKVLRGHLEQLPLPLWGDELLGRLVRTADCILQRSMDPAEADEFIMDHYRLSAAERRHVAASLL